MKGWDFNIFHINDFLKLVECGNFSATADELYITQSSLSKHIQSLERTLGVQLFIRSNHKTKLSEAGQMFLPYAQKFNNLFLEMNKDIGRVINKGQMSFKLGCLMTLEFYGIVEAVADFKLKYPEIKINLIEFGYNTNKTIQNSLTSSEFDLIFCDSQFVRSKCFEKRDFTKDHLVAILHHSHPLAAWEQLDLIKLRDEPLIFLSDETTTYYYSYNLCKETGFIPKVSFYGIHIGNVLKCVYNNMGIALVMKKFTSRLTSDKMVVRDIVPTVERTISMARLKANFYNIAAGLFWDYISTRD
jgi:DNA-binding transcriptional LysR family regulator